MVLKNFVHHTDGYSSWVKVHIYDWLYVDNVWLGHDDEAYGPLVLSHFFTFSHFLTFGVKSFYFSLSNFEMDHLKIWTHSLISISKPKQKRWLCSVFLLHQWAAFTACLSVYMIQQKATEEALPIDRVMFVSLPKQTKIEI